MDNNTDFATFSRNKEQPGRCDLHFLVENEIMNNKSRVEKLEDKTRVSFQELQQTLNGFIVEVRSYIGTQGFRDREMDDIKKSGKDNSTDISDLKSSLKLIIENNVTLNKTISNINSNLHDLDVTVKKIDKSMVGKDEVSEIAKNVVINDKSENTQKWFDSLPAKLSAGMAVISFIAFFTTKIVMLLLGVG